MGVPLPTLRLCLCGQGRRASGYAHASVLRFATHWANAHPPHASRNQIKTNFQKKLKTSNYSK
ncbi:MAG: hypothetical protein NZ519_03785, partial [Bacteroidia bacterium]|nr:hypothetical protein [Bacteroidia bacterium]